MRTMLSMKRNRKAIRIWGLLLAVALVAGMAGCPADDARLEETIPSSTDGLSPIPIEGTSFDSAGERQNGFWLDEILIMREPDQWEGVARLADNDLDLFAAGLYDADLFRTVMDNPDLWYKDMYGSFYTLRMNVYGPEFDDGTLNPFHYAEIREAIQWLINRNHFADVIMGGRALPRYTPLRKPSKDYHRYEDMLAGIEAEYSYDFDEGWTRLQGLMVDPAGATWNEEDQRWYYNGEPVTIKLAIREDDPAREAIGNYLGDTLEDVGFKVERIYGNMNEMLHELANIESEITGGGWNIYTGGWGTTAVSRDEGFWFLYFHTDYWSDGILSFEYLDVSQEFWDAAWDLSVKNFSSMDERSELFELCLWESMHGSSMIYLVDKLGFVPLRANVDLAADTAGGIYGSWLWAHTAHFRDPVTREPAFGGQLRVAMQDLLVEPWNPIAGSNTVYDTLAIRATGDRGTYPDTRDGLHWPGRMEKAEYHVLNGLPVSRTHDWVTLNFVDQILVPDHVWAEWDATTQTFITAAERGTAGETATSLAIAYYPKDIFDVPLHDGSTLSMGDFLMYPIMLFDRAKEESAIYDEDSVGQYHGLIGATLGFEFITDDPNYGLIVKTWRTDFELDAERGISPWFPIYAQGPGMWHNLALGIMAEAAGQVAFGRNKAGNAGVPWTSFIAGDSLPILKANLDAAKAVDFVPYAPTLGHYIEETEAAERWSNLTDWYEERGHFWVASGPYYLHSIDIIDKSIRLRPFEDYPDPKDRWLFLLPRTFRTATGTGIASVIPSEGTIEEVTALAEQDLPVEAQQDMPANVDFPHGFFAFTIEDVAVGGTITVSITLPQSASPETQYWKYYGGQWHEIPMEIDPWDDRVLIITLIDGGLGDTDGLADGRIVDPGGPGYPLSLGYTVGWETQPINKSAVSAPWIALLAAIAGASLLVLRRRQTQS